MEKILYMAPIMGFTNALYRNLHSKHFSGFDVAIAPFIVSVGSGRIRSALLKDLVPEENVSIPVIPQILSNDPEGFIHLAKKMFDIGYETVNWNLGCPFPAVANKKRGSGLLPFPEVIGAILDTVLSEIPNKLSIKTRIGRNAKSEIFELLPVFNQYPISELIIHPRTGVQMYKDKADPDIFEECIKHTNIPIVYNGDINDLDVYSTLLKRFPSIGRFMVGRGAIADPFLPHDIKYGIDNSLDKAEQFKKFHDELLLEYSKVLDGPGHVLGRMKGYWSFFYLSFENGKKLFKKLKKTKNLDNFTDILNRYFDNEAKWIA